MLHVISDEMNSLVCSSSCLAPKPEHDPSPVPEVPTGLVRSVTILKIHHNKRWYTHHNSRDLAYYKFPGFILAFLDSRWEDKTHLRRA
ncbi:unnamed protein product [Lactuca virosa]|uniref:Uncharacterized protein n=1 Tax=Lactuca virosa TaxID=75947 RepID=A0AAU9MEI1_9ASTR|nr:unnamed protein product [Lactuca virosa]